MIFSISLASSFSDKTTLFQVPWVHQKDLCTYRHWDTPQKRWFGDSINHEEGSLLFNQSVWIIVFLYMCLYVSTMECHKEPQSRMLKCFSWSRAFLHSEISRPTIELNWSFIPGFYANPLWNHSRFLFAINKSMKTICQNHQKRQSEEVLIPSRSLT